MGKPLSSKKASQKPSDGTETRKDAWRFPEVEMVAEGRARRGSQALIKMWRHERERHIGTSK